jgi:hypothetical protein
VHHRTGKAPITDPAVWAQHVTWAKVFIAGIAALHESKIVHADLKPPNAYLIRDESIGAGYQLKLIDMDFSVLADRRAPWHGHQGYVGTDNYRSPEHMTKGGVPTLASDVFTSGLILYELLTDSHPYWSDDQADYARKAREHAAKPPALAGIMPSPATNAETSAILHRCLSPEPASRPTAAELRAVLSGRGVRRDEAATASPAAATPARPATTTAKPAATAGAPATGSPIVADRITLSGHDRTLEIGVRTDLGKHLVRQFGSDAEFWDARQCTLERLPDRRWQLTPSPGTANETLLNGDTLVRPRVINEGDVLAVGRKAKGIAKLPLTFRAR